MSLLNFEATPYTIKDWMILRLPLSVSSKLPSRGQVMVKGTINGFAFQTALEPDGKASHWLHVDDAMQKAVGVSAGKPAKLAIESSKDWPEPKVPPAIQAGLVDNPQTHNLWTAITPLARWEWIRWISSTNVPATYQKRIAVSRSKMLAGERRPCCFNRSMCCVPDVAKGGILLGPSES